MIDALSDIDSGSTARTILALRGLADTVSHCKDSVPYYQDVWKNLDIDERDPATNLSILDKLPLLHKHEIIRKTSAFLSTKCQIDGFIETSGTTGHPILVYFNNAEISASRSLLEKRIAANISLHGPREPGFHLRFLPSQRRIRCGHQFESTQPTLTVNYSTQQFFTSRDDATDFVCHMLNKAYRWNDTELKVRSLHITPPDTLDALTDQMLLRGINPSIWGIQQIILSGGPLTARTRRYVAQVWNAQLVTSYSSTETGADCIESISEPGTFYTNPACIYEALNRDGNRCAVGEWGELVVTTLVPFRTVMPFVRYRTQDIVRVVETEAATCRLVRRFEFTGRDRHVVWLPSGRPIGVNEAFAAIGDEKIIPMVPYPIYHMTKGPNNIDLMIEAQLGTEMEWKDCSARIAKRLRSRVHDIDQSEADVAVHLVPKGSLKEHTIIYPTR